jgi:hypothetical protein
MSKHAQRNLNFKSSPASKIVVGTIPSFSLSRRNTVRGIAADVQRGAISARQINVIRSTSIEHDMVAAATILESPGGLRKRSVTAVQQGHIARPHQIEVRSARLEAAYASAFVSAWDEDAKLAVQTIAELARLCSRSTSGALIALKQAAAKWGASMYLARKLTFVKEFFHISDEDQIVLDEIDEVIGHNAGPQLQYSALENVKDTISIFSAARRHTSVFKNESTEGFRRSHSLRSL